MVFRCLLQLSIDQVKAGHCCFKTSGPQGRFLAEIRIPCLIFPSKAKKEFSPLVPFSGQLGKIFKLSAPIKTIFASLLELSTFQRSLLPSNRLQHRLKSTGGVNILLWGRGERAIFFNGNFLMCLHLVSRICHAGVVANVDFKLCRSQCWMVRSCIGKLNTPVVKQKSFELEQKV